MPGDDSMQLPIIVAGAGIGGLALARLLTIKKIPVAVYESKSPGKFANHGIWLGSDTCQRLIMGLQVSLADFSKKVAVTAEVHHDSATPLTSPSGIRVNKRRLLEYLAADVNVQWDAAVTNVSSTNEGLFIEVKDKHATAKEPVTVEGAGIVGADGVHSAVRAAVLPNVKPNVHPYVAINGQRRRPFEEFRQKHGGEDYQNTVSHEKGGQGSHLSMGLNDVKGNKAYSFYTYSRPAKGSEDPLFKPARSTNEASGIPSEFFKELEKSTFATQLDVATVKEDKLLSWLMRSIDVSSADLQSLSPRVTLMGDAVHATPILGGDGAEQAIQDAVELADLLANSYRDGGIEKAMKEYVEGAAARWRRSVEDSVGRLDEMHTSPRKL